MIISYREAITQALDQEMARDFSVIVIGEDIAGGAGRRDQGIEDSWGGVLGTTKGLIGKYGSDRVLDTPISESGFIGAGVSAAMTGLRPVVELMFMDFLGVAYDQIYNQAAKMRYMCGGDLVKVPLTIKTMMGGGLGAAAQHSQVLYALFVHVPGLKVVAPSTPSDMKGLLAAAVRDDDPVIVCEHKALYGLKGEVREGEHVIPLGVADVKRHGKDVTIVAISKMVHEALKAAGELSRQGIDAEVIDPRTLSPLDWPTIRESIAKTGRLVVVDEANPQCGMASEIASLAARDCFCSLKAPIRMVTAPHVPVPFSPPMEAFYLPDAAKVVDTVEKLLRGG